MARSQKTSVDTVNFANRAQAGSWFEGQPRQVCLVLAVRAALRVLPLINCAHGVADFPPRVGLPVFRACFVAWAVAEYPFGRYRLRGAAAAAKAAAFAAAARAAAFAAADAARVAAAAAADAAARAAAFAAAAIRTDALAIEQGREASDLLAMPLWPGGPPDEIVAAWDDLRTMLLADEASQWYPWVLWYNRLRDGRPSLGEEFDIAVATLTDAQWHEEPLPAAVNKRIADLLAEYTPPDLPTEESLPPQTGRATIFQPDAGGVIGIAPPTPADRLADTSEVRDLYTETREKLDELISLGRNMLGDRLDRASRKLQSRMPEAMSEVVERQVWSSGNTLRSIRAAHDAVKNDRDPHPDKLDNGVAERLRDVVDTFNQLAVADLSLRQRDAGRPGPQEHQRTTERN